VLWAPLVDSTDFVVTTGHCLEEGQTMTYRSFRGIGFPYGDKSRARVLGRFQGGDVAVEQEGIEPDR
jgi:hypothetical protein